jgi:hypothetical protein
MTRLPSHGKRCRKKHCSCSMAFSSIIKASPSLGMIGLQLHSREHYSCVLDKGQILGSASPWKEHYSCVIDKSGDVQWSSENVEWDAIWRWSKHLELYSLLV